MSTPPTKRPSSRRTYVFAVSGLAIFLTGLACWNRPPIVFEVLASVAYQQNAANQNTDSAVALSNFEHELCATERLVATAKGLPWLSGSASPTHVAKIIDAVRVEAIPNASSPITQFNIGVETTAPRIAAELIQSSVEALISEISTPELTSHEDIELARQRVASARQTALQTQEALERYLLHQIDIQGQPQPDQAAPDDPLLDEQWSIEETNDGSVVNSYANQPTADPVPEFHADSPRAEPPSAAPVVADQPSATDIDDLATPSDVDRLRDPEPSGPSENVDAEAGVLPAPAELSTGPQAPADVPGQPPFPHTHPDGMVTDEAPLGIEATADEVTDASSPQLLPEPPDGDESARLSSATDSPDVPGMAATEEPHESEEHLGSETPDVASSVADHPTEEPLDSHSAPTPATDGSVAHQGSETTEGPAEDGGGATQPVSRQPSVAREPAAEQRTIAPQSELGTPIIDDSPYYEMYDEEDCDQFNMSSQAPVRHPIEAKVASVSYEPGQLPDGEFAGPSVQGWSEAYINHDPTLSEDVDLEVLRAENQRAQQELTAAVRAERQLLSSALSAAPKVWIAQEATVARQRGSSTTPADLLRQLGVAMLVGACIAWLYKPEALRILCSAREVSHATALPIVATLGRRRIGWAAARKNRQYLVRWIVMSAELIVLMVIVTMGYFAIKETSFRRRIVSNPLAAYTEAVGRVVERVQDD